MVICGILVLLGVPFCGVDFCPALLGVNSGVDRFVDPCDDSHVEDGTNSSLGVPDPRHPSRCLSMSKASQGTAPRDCSGLDGATKFTLRTRLPPSTTSRSIFDWNNCNAWLVPQYIVFENSSFTYKKAWHLVSSASWWAFLKRLWTLFHLALHNDACYLPRPAASWLQTWYERWENIT